MKKTAILSLLATLILFSCNKEENEEVETTTSTGTLRLMLDHMSSDINSDTSRVELDSMAYLNFNGDTVEIVRIKYFISNIKLIKESNDTILLPNSYYLFRQDGTNFSSRQMKNITGVPVGSYKKIQFSIGVDSVHNNVDSAQYYVGDLGGTSNMSWIWETGYRFVQFDGFSRTNGGGAKKELTFHIGGNASYRTVEVSRNIEFEKNKTTMIHFEVMIHNMFQGEKVIDFDALSQVTKPGTDAEDIADNYQSGMFMLHHVEILD